MQKSITLDESIKKYSEEVNYSLWFLEHNLNFNLTMILTKKKVAPCFHLYYSKASLSV